MSARAYRLRMNSARFQAAEAAAHLSGNTSTLGQAVTPSFGHTGAIDLTPAGRSVPRREIQRRLDTRVR